MRQFGVIGFPIEHSLSPDLHSEIYKQIQSIKEINKKVMTKKLQQDKEASKNTLGDANEKLQELKDKMDGK